MHVDLENENLVPWYPKVFWGPVSTYVTSDANAEFDWDDEWEQDE